MWSRIGHLDYCIQFDQSMLANYATDNVVGIMKNKERKLWRQGLEQTNQEHGIKAEGHEMPAESQRPIVLVNHVRGQLDCTYNDVVEVLEQSTGASVYQSSCEDLVDAIEKKKPALVKRF